MDMKTKYICLSQKYIFEIKQYFIHEPLLQYYINIIAYIESTLQFPTLFAYYFQ